MGLLPYSLHTYHTTMKKKILMTLLGILTVLSWWRLTCSQDTLTIVAAVIITIATILGFVRR